MGWVAARDQLVTIIEETTGLSQKGGLPRSLKHYQDGTPEGGLDSRAFFFELIQAADRRLLRSAGATWTTASIDLVVVYREDINPAALLEAQLGDYRAIAVRMLNDVNWGRPSSTITRIGDGEQLLVATIERVEGGSLMRVRIPIDFT